MADQKALKILKQGPDAWNAWRKAELRRRARLEGSGVSREEDLSEAKLVKADLRGARLEKADLREADLSKASLAKANLRGAYLSRARLGKADLSGADLRGANLDKADLRGAELVWAKLGDASLCQADLRGASLIEADLRGADLRVARLVEANLRGADLSRANLAGAVVELTLFLDIDLSNVLGLESVCHHGPSIIGIETIYKSKGQIPEIFLRGTGVPEPFIVQMKALVGAMEPIQFYSCFISYSNKDQDFAERLHADLQGGCGAGSRRTIWPAVRRFTSRLMKRSASMNGCCLFFRRPASKANGSRPRFPKRESVK